jgi:peptide/nickel transport system substrate-binding protein
MSDHPIGSGPCRFVSAEPDKEVVLERNEEYWGQKARLQRVRFAIVPDMTTRALELRKGTADIAINSLTPDMVVTLQREPKLSVLRGPGTVLQYMGFNYRDPILKDVRVRQALAYAIDRRPMLEYLWRGFAQPAVSILPPQSWAYSADVPTYSYDPERARQLLDSAGYRARGGVRFHLMMKTSTDENTRLMVAVLQQQLRRVQIQWTSAPSNLAHSSPMSAAELSSSIPCAGSAETKIRTFLSTLFTPASSPLTARTAVSIRIPRSTG